MSLPRMAAALGVGLFCLSSHPPALAAGPDELEQVKSQLAELRQSYEARLQALEKRIAELQQATATAPTHCGHRGRRFATGASRGRPARRGHCRPVRRGQCRPARRRGDAGSALGDGVQPGDLADPLRPLRQPLARPRHLHAAGLRADRRRGRPGNARLQPRRDRARLHRQHRPDVLRADRPLRSRPTTASTSRKPGSRAPAWSKAATCASAASSPASATSTRSTPTPGTSSTRRWSTRPSSAARSRPTACRCAGWRRPIASSSSAPRSARARRFPAATAAATASAGDALRAPRRRHRRQRQLARRRSRCSQPRRRSAATTTSTAPASRSPTASPAARAPGALDGIWKWAPDGNATPAQLQAAGRVSSSGARAARWRTTRSAQRRDVDGDYSATQTGWYVQAVYQFMPRWRVGLRTERLDSGTPASARSRAAR